MTLLILKIHPYNYKEDYNDNKIYETNENIDNQIIENEEN